jgi:hypothetical protein
MSHFRAARYAGINRALALAEQALRPVDRLDYAIRRCVIPVPFKKTPSIRFREVPLCMPWSIPYAIGQYLQTQYAIERSLPSPLANLLREFEQRNNQGGAFAKGPCTA